MMDRICESEPLFRDYLSKNSRQRRKWIKSCSEQVIKAIIEIVINFKHLPISDKVKRQKKSFSHISKYVCARKVFSIVRLRTFLHKHINELTVLIKVFFGSVFTLCLASVNNV